jgi:hypothetical protein
MDVESAVVSLSPGCRWVVSRDGRAWPVDRELGIIWLGGKFNLLLPEMTLSLVPSDVILGVYDSWRLNIDFAPVFPPTTVAFALSC